MIWAKISTSAGWVDDVPAWINRARVFFSVSSQEGVPTAMIEAMAGGLVPVHTRVGGVPYVLSDGENGYLIDYPTDVYFAARRILQLLDDDERYARMQSNALKVHDQFGLTGVHRGMESDFAGDQVMSFLVRIGDFTSPPGPPLHFGRGGGVTPQNPSQ